MTVRFGRFVTGVAVACAAVVWSAIPGVAEPMPQAPPPMPQDMAAMAMNPYFTALNYPVQRDTMMVMLLSDFQSARTTNDFVTAMGMVQYGLTPRWTVGFMVEGQKIAGSPATYGGLRINSSFR